jgi:hypothetical protein
MAALERNSPAAELERLRLLTDQWMTFQPELIAAGAWYPSAEVRETVAAFVATGQEALKQTGFLFAGKETLLNEAAKGQWRETADAACEAFNDAWNAFVAALNQAPGA